MFVETLEHETVEESPKHRIVIVTIETYGRPKKMYKLYVKHGDREYGFRRAEYCDGKYFYGLKQLQKLATDYNPDDEYFCTHGKGNPFKEFGDVLEHVGFSREKDHWSFTGNHKEYSGAFGYKIFDEDLAIQVEAKLNE